MWLKYHVYHETIAINHKSPNTVENILYINKVAHVTHVAVAHLEQTRVKSQQALTEKHTCNYNASSLTT